jgi:hypothetical protein
MKFLKRTTPAALVASIFVFFGVVAPAQAIGTHDCPTSSAYSTGYVTGAPYFTNSQGGLDGYLYATQGNAFTPNVAFAVTGFTIAPSFSISPSLPAGLNFNTTNGVITGTPTVADSGINYLIMATGPAAASTASSGDFCIGWQLNLTVFGSGGGNGSPYTNTPFTFGSSSITPSADVSNLSAGAAMPGFTVSATGVSAGGQYNLINIAVGDLHNGTFYSLSGASSDTSINNYPAWDPAGANCGITRLTVGGVNLGANSGTTCANLTSVYNGVTQYWVSIMISTASSADFSLAVANGLFTVVSPTNADLINVFASYPDSSTHLQHSGSISQRLTSISPGTGSSGATGPTVAPVAFSIPVAVGQPIVGSNVDITVNDLAISTDYSVVLRSTPQILASGRTVSSSFNTSVTIPAGLEAGWHSITFNATRTDGSALSEVVYFKIDASGLLMATATETPAELAFTGSPAPWGWWIPMILLMLGAMAVLIAREINPDFMRVFSLVRGASGEYAMVKRRIRSDDF